MPDDSSVLDLDDLPAAFRAELRAHFRRVCGQSPHQDLTPRWRRKTYSTFHLDDAEDELAAVTTSATEPGIADDLAVEPSPGPPTRYPFDDDLE